MKKFFIFTLIFLLASCGNSSENSWKIAKNIKNICDAIVIWENFENVKNNFWEPELLASQKTEIWTLETYIYGEMVTEACMITIQDNKIATSNYYK